MPLPPYRWLMVACVAFALSTEVPAQANAVGALENLRLNVVQVDQNNLPLPFQKPEALVIFLGLIPGELFGAPVGAPLDDQPLSDLRQFELDFRRYGERAERDAAPMKDATARSGLLIAPESTRFVRVATVAGNPTTRQVVGFLGFVDWVSNEPLLLVYFDRPCRVSGVVRFGGDEYVHDITIAHRGFHWLHVFETTRGRHTIGNWTGTEDIFLAIRPSP